MHVELQVNDIISWIEAKLDINIKANEIVEYQWVIDIQGRNGPYP